MSESPRGRYLALALPFALLAIYGSLVPFRFTAWPPERLERALAPDAGSLSRIDVAVNFSLLVPFAFFLAGFLARGRGGARAAARAALVCLPVCLAISVAIEAGQLWLPSRTPSITDVAAQLAGALVGLALWAVFGDTVGAWMRRGSARMAPRGRWHWLLQAWVVGLVAWSLVPLDLSPGLAELHEKWKEGRILLLPFSEGFDSLWRMAWEYGLQVLFFVPVGLAMSAPGRSRRAAWLRGTAVAAGIELAQVFVFSRVASTTDVLLGSAGVLAGAWLAGRAAPAPGRVRAAWIVLPVYAVLLVALFWAPFDFRLEGEFVRPRLGAFFGTPLAAAESTEAFHAASALLRKALLFAPLGALCAWAVAPLAKGPRRLLLFVLLALSAGLAFGIELGQVALPGKTGTFGDVLVEWGSALVGAWLGSRWRPAR